MKTFTLLFSFILLIVNITPAQNFNQKYEYSTDEILYKMESYDTLTSNKHHLHFTIYNLSNKNLFIDKNFRINSANGLWLYNVDWFYSTLIMEAELQRIKPNDSLGYVFDLDSLKFAWDEQLKAATPTSNPYWYFEISVSINYMLGMDVEYPGPSMICEGDKLYLPTDVLCLNSKILEFDCFAIWIKK